MTKRRAAQPEAIYEALLTALDALGGFPYFRQEVIEECGKAFERFLETHCLAKERRKPRPKAGKRQADQQDGGAKA